VLAKVAQDPQLIGDILIALGFVSDAVTMTNSRVDTGASYVPYRYGPGHFNRVFIATAFTQNRDHSVEFVKRDELLIALQALPLNNPLHYCITLATAADESGVVRALSTHYERACVMWSAVR
jgi:hypothetical protein